MQCKDPCSYMKIWEWLDYTSKNDCWISRVTGARLSDLIGNKTIPQMVLDEAEDAMLMASKLKGPVAWLKSQNQRAFCETGVCVDPDGIASTHPPRVVLQKGPKKSTKADFHLAEPLVKGLHDSLRQAILDKLSRGGAAAPPSPPLTKPELPAPAVDPCASGGWFCAAPPGWSPGPYTSRTAPLRRR